MTQGLAEDQGAIGMDIDAKHFRDTLGCFATGVTIITTVDSEGGPVGLTANSFSSLSLDPPLVLFCLDRNVVSFPAFHSNRHFAVNILGADQEDMSRRFAQSGPEKWNGVAFETWDTGCPILAGCIATLECNIDSIYEGGDHVIIVGEVVRIANGGGTPLAFFRGRYGTLASS